MLEENKTQNTPEPETKTESEQVETASQEEEIPTKILQMGESSSKVFSGDFQSETTQKFYGESAQNFADIIKENIKDKNQNYKFADFGSYKGELLKQILDLLPNYSFHTIAIDFNQNVQENEIANEKIITDLSNLSLKDKSVDFGIMRYVLQWNTLEKQDKILKEVSRVSRDFIIIQHAGPENDQTSKWRIKINNLLSGKEIPEIKRTNYFFSSRKEVERMMTSNDIDFQRISERRIDKLSNIFIERYSLNENQATTVRNILGDKDYIIQTTWLILPSITTSPQQESQTQPEPTPQTKTIEKIVYKTDPNIIQKLLNKARTKIQERKRKKLDKIMTLFEAKPQITNKDIQKLLRTTKRSSTRYLNLLEQEQKITQVGKTGKSVFYIKK